MASWTCPHCNHPQIPGDASAWSQRFDIPIGETAIGSLGMKLNAWRCLNPECDQPTVSADLTRSYMKKIDTHLNRRTSARIRAVTLIPDSNAKPQPEYIPPALREDYVEACRIRDLSPKSSATLARRCLQGMIRNFCGIKRDRLIDEIKALRKALDDGSAPKGVTP